MDPCTIQRRGYGKKLFMWMCRLAESHGMSVNQRMVDQSKEYWHAMADTLKDRGWDVTMKVTETSGSFHASPPNRSAGERKSAKKSGKNFTRDTPLL